MPWSVFVFLGFFVAATRLEAKGERLEVIGPIPCRAGEAASLSPDPSRHFAPFAVKIGWFVFVFLVFFVAMPWSVLRGIEAKGQR